MSVPVDLVNALSQQTVRPFYAVELLLDTAPIRLWTGIGERVINGDTYLGSGTLLGVGDIDMTTDMSAPSLDITLSGMSGDVISLALSEPYQRRRVRVYFGAETDGAGNHVSHLIYVGTINTMTIVDSADTGTVRVTVDSQMLELRRSLNRRYTSDNHKARRPNDTFFDYVAGIQDAEIVWGR